MRQKHMQDRPCTRPVGSIEEAASVSFWMISLSGLSRPQHHTLGICSETQVRRCFKESGAVILMVESRVLKIVLKSQERTPDILQKGIPRFLLPVLFSHGETLVTGCFGGCRDDRSTRCACSEVFPRVGLSSC